MAGSRYFMYRKAEPGAGETFCLAPDPQGGMVVCTRPAGHTGKHAAHGDDPDKPLWTWHREEESSYGE